MVELTFQDIVSRLYDLNRLAKPPEHGELGGCQSSYDRRSRYNETTGLYEDWNANADGDGYIRKEGDKLVVFEQNGPGVIWRVWSALPLAGHIQVFIDDDLVPVIDMPFRDFFEFSGHDTFPINLPELTPTLSRGRNRFIPIWFQKSCKVLMEPDWGRYYHFTYTTFPKETILPKFTGKFNEHEWLELERVERLLSTRGWSLPLEENSHVDEFMVIVPPGETATICQLEGNRAITGIQVTVDGLANLDDETVLRELCLSMKWDGEAKPSVWSPLGDFFGTTPGVNYYRSLPVGMTNAYFYSHWYMPFARQAKLELHNDGTAAQRVQFKVAHHSLEQDANELLRFHAKWHRDALLEQSQHSGRDIDWPLLNVKGRGRFCGVHLHVWNRWNEATRPEGTTGGWWWWGEGDEKFFVDGETFPSTFGTGSEDYIGYAWAAHGPFPTFDSAFACQPTIEIDANGHTSVNRFHICDDIPFQTSFEGCIEKYKPNVWEEGNLCLYDAVAYWYQIAGEEDGYDVVPLSERIGYWVDPT
jgi:hypothetical protein